MTDTFNAPASAPTPAAAAAEITVARAQRRLSLHRALVIGAIGFLTLVDLFAAQAILPTLVERYGVSRAAMGLAVNASTLGMALSCLIVSLFSRRVDNRKGIWVSLALLAVPTALLAVAPDLVAFTVLRLTQGVFMAAAFTLTMAYLADTCSRADTSEALAAYVTGIVGSNLVGRLVSAWIADTAGLEANFLLFTGLNIAGAVLVLLSFRRLGNLAAGGSGRALFAAWPQHLSNPALRAAFAIGFLLLFAFIGTFTYVNFELAGPLGLAPMSLGLVYLVFLPAMATTPLAGRSVAAFGLCRAACGAMAVALVGLPLLLLPWLPGVLAGMALVAIGTFFAQAIATGFVGRTARADRAAASGLYLAAYYTGGLAGAAVLGQVYDRAGWGACVAGIAAALAVCGVIAARLPDPGA
jgi:predicted MFS family arabinose efflux permease